MITRDRGGAKECRAATLSADCLRDQPGSLPAIPRGAALRSKATVRIVDGGRTIERLTRGGKAMTAGSDQLAGVASGPRLLLAVLTLSVAAAVIAVSAWLATAAGAERAQTGLVEWFQSPRRSRSRRSSLWSIRCFDRYR